MLKKLYNKYKSFSLLLFFSLFQMFFSYSSISKENEILEGEYIAILSGCYSCHTDINSNEPYSGGRKIVTNFGIFYSPNITPDKSTGIGKRTSERLILELENKLSEFKILDNENNFAERSHWKPEVSQEVEDALKNLDYKGNFLIYAAALSISVKA